MMKRSLLAGAVAALVIAIPGTAAAQGYDNGYGYGYEPQNTACARQSSDDKLAGGVAGALIGGLIGGAIGNNIDGGDNHYRGHRGYGRGHGRGYGRGYNRGHSRSSDNSDQVVVGALLGAVVGGLAGSEIAGSSSTNCQSAGPTPYRAANSYNGNGYQGGSIPRTTDGLYGGPRVMDQRGYPYSSPPSRTYPASSYPASSYPDAGYDNQDYDDQGYYDDYSDQAYQGNAAYSQQECRMIYLNGNHVQACRNSPTETWRPVGNSGQEELYGY